MLSYACVQRQFCCHCRKPTVSFAYSNVSVGQLPEFFLTL